VRVPCSTVPAVDLAIALAALGRGPELDLPVIDL